MSYVRSVLQPGEKVIFQGRLHWIAYWPAMLFMVLGVVLVAWLWSAGYSGPIVAAAAIVFGALFVVSFAIIWFDRWTTEIAVTDRRIIYKTGFITRHTEEMNMDKVASVDVDQSIPGRLLNYGTVRVVGTGGQVAVSTDEAHDGIENLRRVAAPLALRNAITAK
jgi:uncharacterized membrane protein YdbT with pleckstrin-like domain